MSRLSASPRSLFTRVLCLKTDLLLRHLRWFLCCTGSSRCTQVKLRTGTGTITATPDSFPAIAILAPSVLLPDRTNVQIQPVEQGVPTVFDNLPPGDYMLYSALPLGYELGRARTS